MDELSSKYMLPIGGLFTALFVIKEWSVKSFVKELGQIIFSFKKRYTNHSNYFILSAILIGFILVNEIILELTGNAIFRLIC